MYIQIIYSSCLVQNFWMETPCMFSLSTSYLVKKCWIESSCMLNLSVLHVWFKILNGIFFNLKMLNQTWSRQVEHTGCFHPKVLNQTWRTDNLFFMSGSKFLDGNTLYVQLVYLISGSTILDWITVCLICQYFMSGSKFCQKFWNRHEELISWIYRVIPSKSVEPDIKYLQIEHTGWFNPKVLNQT
jgi:hypothetical protein